MQNLRLGSPVLIGGSGSSGSTLLASILDSHPEIACAPEMSFFNKKVIYDRYRDFETNLPQWLEKGVPTDGYSLYPGFLLGRECYELKKPQLIAWSGEGGGIKEFMRSLQSHILQRTGTTVFAEKTPSNCYCFGEFLEIFPDAKLLHIVRDGRDVVCSLMKRGMSLFRATSLWLYNTSAGVVHRGRPQYFELSYEELVSAPEETIQQVCDHVRVEFLPGMLDRDSPSSTARNGISSWKNSPTGPITTESVGRFEEELDDSDLARFYNVRLTSWGASKLGISGVTTTASVMASLQYPGSPPSDSGFALHAVREVVADQLRRNKRSLRGGWGIRPPLTWIDLA